MSEHTITQDQAAGIVEKLNGFIATLDEQEQGWLVALLTRPSPEEDVQGYMVLPPFSPIVPPQARVAFTRTGTCGEFSIVTQVSKPTHNSTA